MEDIFDVVIVGAGPVGLYAAYYAGYRSLKVAVIDALPQIGGQVSAMYPEKEIRDIAGFPTILGKDLIHNLHEQASRYPFELVLGETVNAVRAGSDDRLVLTTETGRQIETRSLLIAAGLGRFTPKSLPSLQPPYPGGVLHFVPDVSELDGRRVVIVGGGDSAVDWALAALPRAKSVTVIHRRARFRAHEASVEEIRAGGARIIAPGEIGELRGTSTIEGVVVQQPGAEAEMIVCDRLIMALGFTSDLGAFADWGLESAGIHFKVGADMLTSRKRIFAIGDVSEYPGKVRLIAVGFGEAAIAVNHIAATLNPDQQIFPGHSTHAE